MKNLYVDQLTENEMLGVTNTLHNFTYNLGKISPSYYKKAKEQFKKNKPFYDIVSVGRYIVVVILNKKNKETVMFFVDSKNDYKICYEFAERIKESTKSESGGDTYKNMFIERFMDLKRNYNIVQNDYKLIQPTDFITDVKFNPNDFFK